MDISDRVLFEAREFIKNPGNTVRSVAKVCKMSKSTIFKDLSDRLKYIDKGLYVDVRIQLDRNRNCRNIRGGNVTKEKWRLKRGE